MQMGDNIKVGVKEIGWRVMGLLIGLMWLGIVCILWQSGIGKVMHIGDA
jgi:hypothetical protein